MLNSFTVLYTPLFFYPLPPCIIGPRLIFGSVVCINTVFAWAVRACTRLVSLVFATAIYVAAAGDHGGIRCVGVLLHEETAEKRWLVVRPPS